MSSSWNEPPPSVPAGLREVPAPARLLEATSVVALEPHRRAAQSVAVTLLRPAASAAVRVLVIGDDHEDAESFRDLLGRADETSFTVEVAESAEAGLRRLAATSFDACLVDQGLVGRDGFEVVQLARRRGIMTPLILVGAGLEREMEDAAITAGAADCLDREEIDTGRLERCIRFALLRKRTTDRLDQLAQFDPLTGLANRTLFQDRLEHALAHARRHRCHVGVMVLDLNGFKAVNDRLGHAAGDQLLRTLGERLRTRVREVDTVARLGGDEFALVLENLARPEHAGLIARKLLDAVAPAVLIDGEPASVTASLGVAVYPRDGEDGPTLVRQADGAMYAAKAQGGNVCRFHDDRLDQRSRRGSLIESDLKKALERHEFVLHYQPQVTLGSPELGLASIVRWNHPELGLVDAERFRLLAEDTGLIEPLTDWIIAAACRQARTWLELKPRPFHVSVPILSRRQLAWSRLPERVSDQLQRSGLPRAAIELEFGERLLLEEIEAGGAALEPLRDFGLRVALGGFGSDVSSLRVLQEAPVHTLKLSRRLLEHVGEDSRRTGFAVAVLRLAKQLKLRVVAEGVESDAQLKLLRREGCDAVQSVLSCPPLPPASCAEWLRQASTRPLQPQPAR